MQLLSIIVALFAPKPIIGRAHVIDGDTLAFGRTRVRLWGIDAPELDTWQGRQAKWFLIHKIAGRQVTCIAKGKCRYRRLVAQCYVDGEDIAWWLVKAGHAVDWPQFSGGYYRSGTCPKLRRFIIAYRRRQRAAQSNHGGISSSGWRR